MKKEFIKGLSMLMLIVGLAFVTAIATANGQTSHRLVTDIPFQFVVGDKALPAGRYEVRQLTMGGQVLAIADPSTKISIVRLTNQISANKSNTQARLVFHRYGERYFLAEVWDGESPGKRLQSSRQERAIEREFTRIASTGASQDESQCGPLSELRRTPYTSVEILAEVR
ncbi:MAG: hypothetical protein ABJB97_06875 [Acidobacteriota bacterium]